MDSTGKLYVLKLVAKLKTHKSLKLLPVDMKEREAYLWGWK